MARSKPTGLTANQVVSRNLREARLILGLTQEQAAAQLEQLTGKHWSKSTYSLAENPGGRVKRWDADDLYALALVFNQPVSFFLSPPPGTTVRTGSGRVVQSVTAQRRVLRGGGELQAVSRLLGGPRALREAADLLEQEDQ